MNEEQRNLLLAVVLSVAILAGFQFFSGRNKAPVDAAPETAQVQVSPAVSAGPPAPVSAASAPAPQPEVERSQVLEEAPRLAVRTPTVQGSVALIGGRIDDVVLSAYHDTIDPKSPPITLLSPLGTSNAYYADFGFRALDPAVKTPGPDSRWQVTETGAELTPDHPVHLTWDNGEGLRFVRTLSVDDTYMFTIVQRVENYGSKAVNLFPFAYVSRTGTPTTAGTYVLHEGPLGVADGSLKEMKYDELRKERLVEYKEDGRWAGFTDKYWLTAVASDQAQPSQTRFFFDGTAGRDRYEADVISANALEVVPNGSAESTFHMFAGAKIVALLDDDRVKYGIDKFDLAIDFGWFWFLTKPFYFILALMKGWLGNMGLAIMGLTVVVKLIMFPLANKSYVAMSKMKTLQPRIKVLQDRFADDKMRLQQEMMALYKAEKVNPAAGCLPVLIQIPVFFALYKVLYVTIEMRHAPFIGWIKDLSAPDPTTLFNLFGLIQWAPPAMVAHLGVWPLIMGFTMWLQQRLNPQPADPIQARMFQILPLVFTFMLGQFAAGLVIYWAWSNSLSILQQWVITRKAGGRT